MSTNQMNNTGYNNSPSENNNVSVKTLKSIIELVLSAQNNMELKEKYSTLMGVAINNSAISNIKKDVQNFNNAYGYSGLTNNVARNAAIKNYMQSMVEQEQQENEEQLNQLERNNNLAGGKKKASPKKPASKKPASKKPASKKKVSKK